MIVGMMLFMAIPGVMELPRPLHLVGMAISMTLPMIAWMRIRGHGWPRYCFGVPCSTGTCAAPDGASARSSCACPPTSTRTPANSVRIPT
jgi:hypothetical protein